MCFALIAEKDREDFPGEEIFPRRSGSLLLTSFSGRLTDSAGRKDALLIRRACDTTLSLASKPKHISFS